MLKRWINAELSLKENNSSLKDEILKNRNYTDEYKGVFLHPVFKVPQKLKSFVGLNEAAKLVKKWIAEEKRICIYSDYDVDGTSASSIMLRMFEYLDYSNVFYYVPDRFKEGYGLNKDALQYIHDMRADAVITVDCGIRAVSQVLFAKNLGLDILITDHHSLPEELPKADLILNPKLSDPNSSHYELCGAGVAMYLALLILDVDEKNYNKYNDIIQLGALATVADLVPLLGENRAIVKEGLKYIKNNPITGLKALTEASGRDISNINSQDISFALAPRINSAGRMASAKKSIELLISRDKTISSQISKELDELNNKRRSIQDDVLNSCVEFIENDPKYRKSGMIIVWGDNWHEGVLGIVSSKLVDIYHLPCIVMSKKNEILKGSARSIEGFSIYSAINSGIFFLERFGGHEMACGLSLKESSLNDFISSVKEYCDKHLDSKLLSPSIKTYGPLPTRYITFDGIEEILSFEPFGVGNPEPLFFSDNFNLIYGNILGKNKDTLKFSLIKDGRIFDAIYFNKDKNFTSPRNVRIDIAFKPSLNVYNGISKITCIMEDFRIYEPAYSFFSRTAFSLYSKSLIEWVYNSENSDLTLCSGKKVEKNEFLSLAKESVLIGVNSFESLLEAMYILFDSGFLSGEISDFYNVGKYIKVLPLKSDKIKYFYGVEGIYGTSFEERKSFYKSLILSQLDFDRENFGKVYLRLKELKKSSVSDLLLKSEKPINTMLSLYFFEESNFLKYIEDQVEIIEKKHGKSDYEKSLIKSKSDLLFMYFK